MAPEIEAGLPHDASADVWSLGQLTYQLLSRQPKYKKPGYFVEEKPVHWLDQVNDDVINLVQSMVKPNPEDRPKMVDVLSHPWI